MDLHVTLTSAVCVVRAPPGQGKWMGSPVVAVHRGNVCWSDRMEDAGLTYAKPCSSPDMGSRQGGGETPPPCLPPALAHGATAVLPQVLLSSATSGSSFRFLP